MRQQAMQFVIIVADPTGVGKTTLSKMLCSDYDCVYLSEDDLAKEMFPDDYIHLEDDPGSVEIIAKELFKRASGLFNDGKCMVIDLINLEAAMVEEAQKTFQHHLILKVLWPLFETTVERDRNRGEWTSGDCAIKRFYQKYAALQPVIGAENYIDNSCQTPEETLETFIAWIK